MLLITAAIVMISAGCSNSKQPANTTDATAPSTGTEVNATELTSTASDDNNENETTSSLPEGMAYQLEDGSFISIESLLAPMNTLNSICAGLSDSPCFTNVYPDGVCEKLIEYNQFDSVADYADFLYTTYVQMYGSEYTLSNEYISCNPLDEEQLDDMIDFYNKFFFTDIEPEYAFIVNSEFCVTYKDDEGNEQQDCSSDYYIAYLYNNTIYLDYFYVDSLDL